MLRQNRIFALCYRTAAFVLCLLCILVTLGVFDGKFSFSSLLYYTLQSNIMVLVFFGVLIYKTAMDLKNSGKTGSNSHYPRISALVMLSITVTLLVYWCMLAPTFSDPKQLLYFYNLGVHLITPLLMIADYILFTVPGKLKIYDPVLFALVPITYWLQATVLGFSGVIYRSDTLGKTSHFPYFFIDYYISGWFVALYVLIISAVFIAAAYALLYTDRIRGRRLQNANNNEQLKDTSPSQ